MAKTLKSILETYAPRSEDEKRFIDKHPVVKHSDRNGNGDEVFKAKRIKIVKRAPEHGHEVGKDHEVYEETDSQRYDRHYNKQPAHVRNDGLGEETVEEARNNAFGVHPKNNPKFAKARAEYEEKMQRAHTKLNRGRSHVGPLTFGSRVTEEAHPSGAALKRAAQAKKKARAIALAYNNQKSGKRKSESYKLPDGRWASRDVKEDVRDLSKAAMDRHEKF